MISSIGERIKFMCVLMADLCGWLSFVNPDTIQRFVEDRKTVRSKNFSLRMRNLSK